MANKLQYLHPFLFAIAPAIFLLGYNFAEIQTREVAPAIAVLIVFGGLVFAVCHLFYRDPSKAAILASVILFLMLFYQYIFYNPFTSQQFVPNRYTVLLSFAVIAISGYVLKKTQRNLAAATRIFVAVSGMFILLSLFRLGVDLSRGYNRDVATQNKAAVMGINTLKKPENLRDIYYIILDEYAAPDVIKEVMGYKEGDEINNWLRQQGFFVAKSSRSNYPATSSSLPSSLNMRYLKVEEDKSKQALTKLTLDHLIKDIFIAYGYRYIHLGSDWVDRFNPYADQNIQYSLFSPYQTTLWETTMFFKLIESRLDDEFGIFSEKLGVLTLLDGNFRQWKGTQYQFAELAKIPERKEPTLTFAHIMLPHQPYVFDADGNYITRKESAELNPINQYLGQVAFANSQIKKLVNKILEGSEPEPIIILQADHGWRGFISSEITDQSSPQAVERRNLVFRILNAYYFPDGGGKVLYDSISPVNSFRALLNYYFGQDLEFLEDIAYFAVSNQD